MASKVVMQQPVQTRPKQKLWFDPKNPPKTPIYVGQRIPIYVVPDDEFDIEERLVNPSWKMTNWVFRIVGIRCVLDENNVETEVVDVKWPNGHIDKDIPISNMYGHFTRIPKYLVPRFTEEYHTDEDDDDIEIIDLSKATTNQEKLEQLLKMLQFLSEQRERLQQEGSFVDEHTPTVTVEETTDAPTVLNGIKCARERDDLVVIKEEGIEDKKDAPERSARLFPALSPETIAALRAAALKKDLEEQAEAEAQQQDQEQDQDHDQEQDQAQDQEKDQSQEPVQKQEEPKKAKKTPSVPKKAGVTKANIAKWFRQPAKGGWKITELRKKALQLGIEKPQAFKKPELKREMLKLAR